MTSLSPSAGCFRGISRVALHPQARRRALVCSLELLGIRDLAHPQALTVVREAHLANHTSPHCTTHLCSFRAIAQKVPSSTLEEPRHEMTGIPSLLVDPDRLAAQA